MSATSSTVQNLINYEIFLISSRNKERKELPNNSNFDLHFNFHRPVRTHSMQYVFDIKFNYKITLNRPQEKLAPNESLSSFTYLSDISRKAIENAIQRVNGTLYRNRGQVIDTNMIKRYINQELTQSTPTYEISKMKC